MATLLPDDSYGTELERKGPWQNRAERVGNHLYEMTEEVTAV